MLRWLPSELAPLGRLAAVVWQLRLEEYHWDRWYCLMPYEEMRAELFVQWGEEAEEGVMWGGRGVPSRW